MNILFLIENIDNRTALNLIDAIKRTGHKVDVLPYFQRKVEHCKIIRENKAYLLFEGRSYHPSDYDAAFLWSWGTAPLGRKYLRVFEEQGVHVLNSTQHTEITDSKIELAKLLRKASVPSPNTLVFESGFSSNSAQKIKVQLVKPPYVFKVDYGTQGLGVHFAFSIKEIQQLADKLKAESPNNCGFIVQEFIGDPNVIISHYRALVIGDTVLPVAIKATATEKLCVSNIAAGASTELVPIHNAVKEIALNATKSTGLKVAGVDIMIRQKGKREDIVVLEVNDGPGTKTFDSKGFQASKLIIDFFINELDQKIPNDINSEQVAISANEV